jgi:hypothetical protein
MWFIHTIYYPEHINRLKEFWVEGISITSFISSFLLLMPLFFAAISLSAIISNYLVWIIPPLRKIFSKEAEGVKGTSFPEAMSGLFEVAKWMVPICLALSLIGALTLRTLR